MLLHVGWKWPCKTITTFLTGTSFGWTVTRVLWGTSLIRFARTEICLQNTFNSESSISCWSKPTLNQSWRGKMEHSSQMRKQRVEQSGDEALAAAIQKEWTSQNCDQVIRQIWVASSKRWNGWTMLIVWIVVISSGGGRRCYHSAFMHHLVPRTVAFETATWGKGLTATARLSPWTADPHS